ncbi:MAG: glutamyl-tRNA reductase [Nitrosopumilus sp.]
MNQNIINARVTFRNSPIHILEKFTIKNMDNAYEQFKMHSGLDECVIIQTCNRIELFGKSQTYDLEKIKKTWASLTGLDEDIFNENMEFVENQEAIHHLLKLTSGLDSMVLGEEQILGQIKNSITSARKIKASGQHLNTLFDKAIRIGTRIRNSSGIGRGGISVGSIAVKLAEENIDELKTKKILLIGTGEVSTLVAKSLQRRGYAFDVTSRTMGRSHTFCETMGGEPVKFEEILSGFGNYDILFVATTAPYFLVTHERIMEAMKDKNKGMMILDLSNPRTVDEKVATIGGVKLMNLDQIAEMVEKNMNSRLNKVKTIENIINEEVTVLEASMKRLEAEPLVKEVFKNIEYLREKELQKALHMLGEKDEEKIKIIDELTKAVVESIVSTPMNNIRKASEQGKPDVVELASKLFDYKKQNQPDYDYILPKENF